MAIEPNEIGPLDERPKYGFTCLQSWLKIENEEQAMEVADAIGSLLVDLGFNEDDSVNGSRAMIVATSEAPEMSAWIKGPGVLMEAVANTCVFILIPHNGSDEDA